MKKRIALIVLLFLIPLGGGWFWYQSKPEQKINTVVDLFLEHVEHRKPSLRQPDDVKNAFNETLAEKVNLQLEKGFLIPPPGERTRQEIIDLVGAIHNMTMFCELTEIERSLKVIGPEAQIYLTANVRAGQGKNVGSQTWELVFDLEKKETWQITGIRGTSGTLKDN